MSGTKIVIDELKCNGCGLCVTACHEGALEIIDGKAKMVRENFCDGMGDCIPACPQGAITFIDAKAASGGNFIPMIQDDAPCSCPSSGKLEKVESPSGNSELRQWPIKSRLLPETSPYFNDADLLLVADCAGFAYPNMHERFIKGRTVMIGCPKFDPELTDKLTRILSNNNIRTLTVVRMDVPCCSLDKAVEKAKQAAGKNIPQNTFIINRDGTVTER